jgi:ADP-ribose pyrophosphatase YjhB (NUDIX family)
MTTIKKFNQFNTSEWIGPVKILDVNESLYRQELVKTNLGEFKNVSGNKLTIGYSYILRVVDNEIVDTGMSCADLVVLVDTGTNYKVLSIKRGRPPFVGMWANPGGNIDEGEQPLDAASRELEEETGLMIPGKYFTYVGAFDKEFRDPRNKNCVSHAFAVILDEIPVVKAGDDATECTWNDVSYDGDVTVDMAFDHAEIIKKSIQSI